MYALSLEALQAWQDAQKAPNAPSAAERLQFIESRAQGTPTVANGTATINVTGILTAQPDLIAQLFFGNTSYGQIIDALDAAESDPSVRNIVLNIESPGGQVDGLFEVIDRLQAVRKPMTARASKALSAAFAIAAQASQIEATNRAAQFGSVGVVASMYVDSRLVHVTSTEAPRKRPDVRTDEGKAVVRETLDAFHNLFVEAIAKGRKTTAINVNANYGRGAVLLADDAKRFGMITSIASGPARTTTSASAQKVKAPMFAFSDLRSTNPELAAQLEAVAGDNAAALYNEIASEGYREGYEEQLMAERARCIQHVDAAERAGDPMLALDAVNNGTPYDEQAMQGYMQAAMDAPQWRGGRLVSAGAPDVGDFVVAEMLRKRGRTAEADAIAPAPAMPLATTPRKMTDDELQEEIVRLMAAKGRGR